MRRLPPLIDVREDVAAALARRRPVVALESAVVSHGLPHPIGLQMAGELEEIVRAADAVPAIVAVLAGRIRVGVTQDELNGLISAAAMKVASRDLPVAAAAAASGGTTVSATVAVADLVGIGVVATGGIGGVHLGAEQSWDVSADLQALAEHPVAVVCAGAKAVCDIGKTLEYLDSAGVTVVAYRSDRFPNFYVQDSGFPAPRQITSTHEAAAILAAKRALGQRTGVVIANPIPVSEALSAEEVDHAVRDAAEQARAAGVRGGDLTPYLLAVLVERTGGRSLRANLSLLRANAALAAAVAAAVSHMTPAAPKD